MSRSVEQNKRNAVFEKPVPIRFLAAQIEELDLLARTTRIQRQELVRIALEEFLARYRPTGKKRLGLGLTRQAETEVSQAVG